MLDSNVWQLHRITSGRDYKHTAIMIIMSTTKMYEFRNGESLSVVLKTVT